MIVCHGLGRRDDYVRKTIMNVLRADDGIFLQQSLSIGACIGTTSRIHPTALT